MVNDLFGDGNGAREASENVPRVGIVMTDGQSSGVMAPAENARAKGIVLFAIGIGTGINEAELKEIANDPDSKFVFQVHDFDVIENIRSLVSQEACEGRQHVQLEEFLLGPVIFVRLILVETLPLVSQLRLTPLVHKGFHLTKIPHICTHLRTMNR